MNPSKWSTKLALARFFYGNITSSKFFEVRVNIVASAAQAHKP